MKFLNRPGLISRRWSSALSAVAICFCLFAQDASAQSGVDREVSWINATQYTDGSALPVGTFETVVVVNGVEAARVPSTATATIIADLPWGDSEYYAYHVDNQGRVGLASNVIMNEVPAVPNPPTGVTVGEVLAALISACNEPGNPNAFREVCELVASL